MAFLGLESPVFRTTQETTSDAPDDTYSALLRYHPALECNAWHSFKTISVTEDASNSSNTCALPGLAPTTTVRLIGRQPRQAFTLPEPSLGPLLRPVGQGYQRDEPLTPLLRMLDPCTVGLDPWKGGRMDLTRPILQSVNIFKTISPTRPWSVRLLINICTIPRPRSAPT